MNLDGPDRKSPAAMEPTQGFLSDYDLLLEGSKPPEKHLCVSCMRISVIKNATRLTKDQIDALRLADSHLSPGFKALADQAEAAVDLREALMQQLEEYRITNALGRQRMQVVRQSEDALAKAEALQSAADTSRRDYGGKPCKDFPES